MTDKKKVSKMKSFARAALAIVAEVMTASLIACGGDKAIQIVKSAHIDDYPNKTMGEAFEDFFDSPKWEEGVPEDDELREQGITLVNFTGKMMYADKEVEAVIQFQANKDTGAFKFEAFELNGIPQDLLTTAVLFEKIFEDGNTAEASDTSDASDEYDSDEYGTDEADETVYISQSPLRQHLICRCGSSDDAPALAVMMPLR